MMWLYLYLMIGLLVTLVWSFYPLRSNVSPHAAFAIYTAITLLWLPLVVVGVLSAFSKARKENKP